MIFDGKKLAEKIKLDIAEKIKKTAIKPGLASILVGDDKASEMYVAMKERAAKECGISFFKFALKEASRLSSKDIIGLIKKLNVDKKINGILVQLPLPRGLDTDKIIAAIDPRKDVDGLRKNSKFLSATVKGVLKILEELGARNKQGMIVGNKGEVGKRLTKELGWKGMDKEDFDLAALRKADVIISCTGQPGLITREMVKDGVVAIDVGYPKGDFAPEVANVAEFFTPVPGGVGPMTVAMLLQNTFLAAKRSKR